MPAIDHHRQLHRRRTAVLIQRIQGGAHRASREQHVVDEDDAGGVGLVPVYHASSRVSTGVLRGLVDEALLDAGEPGLQLGDDAADRAGAHLHELGLVGELTERGGDSNFDQAEYTGMQTTCDGQKRSTIVPAKTSH